MKVALLVPVWDDPTLPGLARDLAAGLAGRVDYVVFARARRRGAPRRLRDGGLDVRLVGWTAPPALRALEPAVNFVRVPFELALAVRREKPDLVHYHFPGNDAWLFVGLWAPFLPAPLLATVHSPLPGLHLPEAPLKRWLCRRVLGAARAVSAVSEHARRCCAAFEPAAARKLSAIPNGVDAAFFTPAGRPRPHARRYVLSPSRGSLGKGLDVLLLAFHDVAREHPGVDLLVCGPEEGEDPMRAFAQALGLGERVRWLGLRSKEQVAALLEHCELLALGSRMEGLSLAALEALAAGVPVVATDVPGTRECVVDGENGLLAPPKAPGALAQALGRVLGDAGLRARLSAGAARSAAGHDRARMCAGYLGWYLRALGPENP